jgi:hypothetical protein
MNCKDFLMSTSLANLFFFESLKTSINYNLLKKSVIIETVSKLNCFKFLLSIK